MERATSERRHIPVLLQAILDHVAPVSGVWVDGTLGAGGYAKGLLDAGAEKLIGIDRDPLAHELAAVWAVDYGDRVELHQTTFSKLDEVADQVDGVVVFEDLDIGARLRLVDEGGFEFAAGGVGGGDDDSRVEECARHRSAPVVLWPTVPSPPIDAGSKSENTPVFCFTTLTVRSPSSPTVHRILSPESISSVSRISAGIVVPPLSLTFVSSEIAISENTASSTIIPM